MYILVHRINKNILGVWIRKYEMYDFARNRITQNDAYCLVMYGHVVKARIDDWQDKEGKALYGRGKMTHE